MMKKILKSLLSLLFWLAVWLLLSAAVGSPLLLPRPDRVLLRLAELACTGRFWGTVGLTLLRILCGILAGTLLGLVLAVLTSRFSLLNTLFSPLLTVIKATPVASFIVLILLWVGREILPAVIVVLMVLPVVWANVSAGIAGVDRKLLELADVYGFSRRRRLKRIYLPSVLPHFVAALRSALGMAWKAGVAAEVLTVPAVSIGRQLTDARLYLEIPDLFAWTLVVILCSLAVEKLLIAGVARLSGRKGGGKA